MDLYRDLPEPRSRESYAELDAALKELTTVVAIERVGYFKGPPALADSPNRIAANNNPKDISLDGVFRRGLLIYEDGQSDPIPSLSLAVALEYFKAHEIAFEFTDGADGKP